ncbi:MAG: 3-oxoacid CoA-transferase [Deltaproteobacteria bacterium]|jgi:glutaconate CoA-transferase, subunit B|nr:3-oxoacid CoA-transferase [Deltaproteobacteria bacterium]
MSEYNSMEMMICVAARFMEDGCSAVVGTGAPCAAGMLAQKTTSPNMLILFEAGGVAPLLPTMPVSVGDSRTTWKALMASSMTETMSLTARGMVDYAFLGGAQIDKYGNLNSTMIGNDYRHPKVRLPGSGGANDLASNCWRVMVITPHEKRRFVEKVDFITSPGYLEGRSSRDDSGLPADTGTYKIVTNLAVMGFDNPERQMEIETLSPGVTVEEVQENTGFELLIKSDVHETEPPSKETLRILREEVDPHKYIIGR